VHITGQAVSHAAAQGTGTDAAATNGATPALTRESKDANKEKESTGKQSKDNDTNTHMAPTKIFKDLRDHWQVRLLALMLMLALFIRQTAPLKSRKERTAHTRRPW
jgi:hypothetical protein